jgi:hypothetical protein
MGNFKYGERKKLYEKHIGKWHATGSLTPKEYCDMHKLDEKLFSYYKLKMGLPKFDKQSTKAERIGHANGFIKLGGDSSDLVSIETKGITIKVPVSQLTAVINALQGDR